MSADHPLAKRKRLTLGEYLRCSHLVIDIIDGEQPLIANRLREPGRPPRYLTQTWWRHYFMVWHPRLTTTQPNSGCATRFAPVQQ